MAILSHKQSAVASTKAIQNTECQVGITLTQNLIANSGAEASQGVSDTTTIIPPECWATSSNFTTIMYDTDGFPLSNTVPSGGVNFFGGGPAIDESTAVQSVDISSLSDFIDTGLVNATLKGFLGGYADTNDNMTIVAEFQTNTFQELGKITIGPLFASERDNTTFLLPREASSLIPENTEHIVITMTASREDGEYNDGYADNLSLELNICDQPIRFGTNLIVNGTGENDLGATNDISANSPFCWKSTPNFTSVNYGAEIIETGGEFPAPGSVPDGGNNLFAGGIDTEVTTATQTIVVSDLANEIDNGEISASLSAYIGGFSDHDDNISITATFLSSSDETLGYVKIGPVIASDRNNETMLLPLSAITALPVGTQEIKVTIVSTRQDGRYNDGFADNVSLVLYRTIYLPLVFR